MLDPATYPLGLADGKAHLVRVRYTPGFHAEMLSEGPTASSNSLKYWVHEGRVSAATFPHESATGTWRRADTGTLQVCHDQMGEALMLLPVTACDCL